jgi:Zn-dependent protease with chaperone function
MYGGKMSELYPVGPHRVPQNLTDINTKYKKHVWLAFGSLVIFIICYLGLTSWFGYKSYTLFQKFVVTESDDPFVIVGAISYLFLAVFLVKAIFFIKRGSVENIEVTEKEEPELFQFINKIADDANAPRPHKVFISPDVNACVFYNLSFLNLIFPTKKNLVIGLGLVNSLNLAEFKAVLAHEFGHFTQNSMAVGRWVYIAQQVAYQIIYKRDFMDRFLSGMSRTDFRVAWIGWLLSLIVWAIRAVLDNVFLVVVAAERALSREMEFHADLVSVSLSGSDALIHGLHKLHGADCAWNEAVSIASHELAANRLVSDLFTVQSEVTKQLKRIYSDKYFDQAPPLPNMDKDKHRVFNNQIAQAPKMWSTHPSNIRREDNAKQQYVEASLDERSAWLLFKDRDSLCKRITQLFFDAEPSDELEIVAGEEIIERVQKRFSRNRFEERYRGIYMGRSPVFHTKYASDLFEELETEVTASSFQGLYSERLTELMDKLGTWTKEKDQLESIRDGFLKPQDGVIRYGDKVVKRKELGGIIKELGTRLDAVRDELKQFDFKCRSLHLAAARKLSNGWYEHLSSLIFILHYANHALNDLEDAKGHFDNTWAVIVADGNISGSERKRLIKACNQVHEVMIEIHDKAKDVVLSSELLQSLKVESWLAFLGDRYQLPAADKNNIEDWVSVIESWVDVALYCLSALESEVLEHLLESESYVEECLAENKSAKEAPGICGVPDSYKPFSPEDARPIQMKLGLWDRFQLADGFFPGLVRLTVAFAIVGPLIYFGSLSDISKVYVYNAFDKPVFVQIAGQTYEVGAEKYRKLGVMSSAKWRVRTRNQEGQLIEDFMGVGNGDAISIYNVANGGVFFEWVRTKADEDPTFYSKGNPRWFKSEHKYNFVVPGNGIEREQVRKGNVVAKMSEPDELLRLVRSEKQKKQLILSHAKWNSSSINTLLLWFDKASKVNARAEVVKTRLGRDKNDVPSLFLEHDLGSVTEDKSICARHLRLSESQPENMDFKALSIKCIDNPEDRLSAFKEISDSSQTSAWMEYHKGREFSRAGLYDSALQAFKNAFEKNKLLEHSYASDLVKLKKLMGLGNTD